VLVSDILQRRELLVFVARQKVLLKNYWQTSKSSLPYLLLFLLEELNEQKAWHEFEALPFLETGVLTSTREIPI
jgi:hypothetical protein